MNRLLPLLLMLLVLPAAPAAAETPTPQVRATLLAAHNATRQELGLPPLVWDEALARGADTYARRLVRLKTLEHSPKAERPNQGENLWMGTAGHYPPAVMVGHWAGEKTDFKYGAFPDVSRSGNWHGVGHYTQMIWASTTHVGCAIASGGGWDYLVCRYSPPGNWMGEKPY